MPEIICDCDCHFADSGALICSACLANHRPDDGDEEKAAPRITRSVEQDYDADKGRKRRHVVVRCDGWMV
jgi:hypothetical protein